jgi:hypothetical protein
MTREEAVTTLRQMRLAVSALASMGADEAPLFSVELAELWGRIDCALEIAVDDVAEVARKDEQ